MNLNNYENSRKTFGAEFEFGAHLNRLKLIKEINIYILNFIEVLLSCFFFYNIRNTCFVFKRNNYPFRYIMYIAEWRVTVHSRRC